MSSDPIEIAPGLWAGFYAGPPRVDGGPRRRLRLTTPESCIRLSYEDACALRRWMAGGDGPGCAQAHAEVERLQAIIWRVTARMETYREHDVAKVNVRQVLSLLSPTWPDGNYEARAPQTVVN